MSGAFFDSNVLLYGYAANDRRAARAQEVIAAGGATGVQCLNEFASAAYRKMAVPWDRLNEALALVTALCDPIVPVTLDVHQQGMRIAEMYRLSIYDGMMLAAALAAGCGTVYSEDMHAGLVVDGRLRIVNPFA